MTLVHPDVQRSADSDLIHADGSVPFVADQSLGGNKLTNVEDPASAQDAATKAYVDTAVGGAVGAADLADLGDVTITSPAVGQLLMWNGTAWVNTHKAPRKRVTLTFSSTVNIDWTLGSVFYLTLTGDCALTFSNVIEDDFITLHIKQDGTGGHEITNWTSYVKWGGGSAPVATATAGRTTSIGLQGHTAGGTPKMFGRVLDLDVDI